MVRHPSGLETIQDTERRFTIVIRQPRNPGSVRGRQEYRRALKDIVTQCEGLLGVYRRRKK